MNWYRHLCQNAIDCKFYSTRLIYLQIFITEVLQTSGTNSPLSGSMSSWAHCAPAGFKCWVCITCYISGERRVQLHVAKLPLEKQITHSLQQYNLTTFIRKINYQLDTKRSELITSILINTTGQGLMLLASQSNSLLNPFYINLAVLQSLQHDFCMAELSFSTMLFSHFKWTWHNVKPVCCSSQQYF